MALHDEVSAPAAMNIVAEIIVASFALFLLAVTAVTFAKPAIAERFFNAFASSAQSHYVEQAVRLLVGASLVLASALMWHPRLFWLIGWMIIASSIALIVTPRRWHFRFGERIRPALMKYMKLFAIGISIFAVLLLYGIAVGPAGEREKHLQSSRHTRHAQMDTLVTLFADDL